MYSMYTMMIDWAIGKSVNKKWFLFKVIFRVKIN